MNDDDRIRKLFDSIDSKDHGYLLGVFFNFAMMRNEILVSAAFTVVAAFADKFGADVVREILDEKTGLDFSFDMEKLKKQ